MIDQHKIITNNTLICIRLNKEVFGSVCALRLKFCPQAIFTVLDLQLINFITFNTPVENSYCFQFGYIYIHMYTGRFHLFLLLIFITLCLYTHEIANINVLHWDSVLLWKFNYRSIFIHTPDTMSIICHSSGFVSFVLSSVIITLLDRYRARIKFSFSFFIDSHSFKFCCLLMHVKLIIQIKYNVYTCYICTYNRLLNRMSMMVNPQCFYRVKYDFTAFC